MFIENEKLNQIIHMALMVRHIYDVDRLRRLLTQLYLAVLSRRPTDNEYARGQKHLRAVPDRAEAVEDLIWVLVNSTEFLTKR